MFPTFSSCVWFCFWHLQLVIFFLRTRTVILFSLLPVLSSFPIFISTSPASPLENFIISDLELTHPLSSSLPPSWPTPILFNLLSFRSNLLSHLPSYCVIILDHDPFLLFCPLHRMSQDLYLLSFLLSFDDSSIFFFLSISVHPLTHLHTSSLTLPCHFLICSHFIRVCFFPVFIIYIFGI